MHGAKMKKKQFKIIHIVNKYKHGASGFQSIYNPILYMVRLWSGNNVEKIEVMRNAIPSTQYDRPNTTGGMWNITNIRIV